jgi:ABC-type transport system involved in Fe-S cluster assembly fused permease/ATPase subunit
MVFNSKLVFNNMHKITVSTLQGPSIIEMVVVAIIFNSVYHSTGAAWSLALTFIAYCTATFVLSRRRARLRQTMHRADNEANQIAVDTLTGFETVKTFTNEGYELQRYSDAVKGFQVASREQQASYVTLNITQSFIIRTSTVSVLIFGAMDVLNGKMSAGGFVALLSYVAQVYAPLSWLGAMYNMLVSAYTDMMNLADLMQEQPDIRDAPGAQQLRIGEGEGASIEFKDVVFKYPAPALDRIESTMERSRRTDAALATPATGFFARIGAFFTRRPQYSGIEQADVELGQVSSATPAASPELLPTLRGISFSVRSGTTTAIVGPTGSGTVYCPVYNSMVQ